MLRASACRRKASRLGMGCVFVGSNVCVFMLRLSTVRRVTVCVVRHRFDTCVRARILSAVSGPSEVFEFARVWGAALPVELMVTVH